MAKSRLAEFVSDDIENQKGVAVPVSAGLLERLFVRSARCTNLHPNPEDEFSMDSVGPSYGIIGDYEKKFRDAMNLNMRVFDDPLIVEKLRPQGYLLLNGHHRWAAAMRCNIKRVPIKIVNCTTEYIIRSVLERSTHNKRVTIDLEEVIFRPEDYPYLEKKAFIFPFSLRFKHRIRMGIPAFLFFLEKHGYDIWVYAADYYSIDDICKFFKAYSVNVDVIITGVSKRRQNKTESEIRMDQLIANKYSTTLHIDNETILETHGKSGEFFEHAIDSSEEDWSKKAIAIVEEIEKRAN